MCAEIEKSKQPRKKFTFRSQSKVGTNKSQNKEIDNVEENSKVEDELAVNKSLFNVAGSICVENRSNAVIDINTLRPSDNRTQIQLLMRQSNDCDVVM